MTEWASPILIVVAAFRSLMGDDITVTMAELRAKGIECIGEPEATSWGVGATMVLPGGVEILPYQPRHPAAI